MVKIKVPLDILTYLVVALGLGPLFLWLDVPVQVIVFGAFIAGILCDKRQRYWFGSRLATALTLLFFIFYSLQINLNNVVLPVINVLALLLSIRLLTEKQGRHYLQMFALSLFCLAASSLLSLNIAYLPALILMVAGVTIGLVLLTFYQRSPGLRLQRQQLSILLKTATILPVGSLLLMLILFVVLPRTQYPLWNFLNPKNSAKTGFSEQVQPGTFARNVADKSVAFRVKIKELAREDLYWRGTVLTTITGKVWTRESPQGPRRAIVGGQTIDYTLTLPPTNERFLFTLDLPEEIEGISHQVDNDQVFMARRQLEKSHSYNGQSRLGGQLQQPSNWNRDLYLQVPSTLSSRIKLIADTIRQQTDSLSQRVVLLEDFFREQKLSYADHDLPVSTAPIDEFLFTKKRGYCEFFASSFAQLLRLCEVPTRLVGGYHGGEYNNIGGYYVVTEDLAHVWVEALIENRWQRIDPSRLAVNADSALLAPRQQGLSLFKRTVDGAEYLWTQVIINYDLRQQINLVKFSGQKLKNIVPGVVSIRTPLLILTVLVALITLLIWLWRRQRISPEGRLLKRYQKAIIKKYGLQAIDKNCGLLEFAQQLDDPHAIKFARYLSSFLYTDQSLTDDDVHALNVLIDTIIVSSRNNQIP
ncbi:Transglutaminase-like superfamily protein [Desulfuromusa kysingii]|uniref:Transglutaminase-like superfamily protein n=1 Tax=Desulfuromusa kysingii TaxID=37625 RepID=A0A1H4BN98_9BACT|nr:DUF3488 and transglutaminase-like domain-containing protein [Desulfuromusa kysingii]SEA49528.1 Transglutaminase-like superfamily protein [Desulfuromusa kysingii]